MQAAVIDAGIGNLRVWSGGDPALPGLLLLHAGLGDAEFSWGAIWKELSEKYHVIAPDLPGFGESPAIPEPSAAKFVEMIHVVLQRSGVREATVIGNSLGAGIAFEYAARFPAETRKCILVDGCAFADIPAALRSVLRSKWIYPSFVRLGYRKFFGDAALRKEFAHPEALSPEAVRKFRERGSVASEVGAGLWLNSSPAAKGVDVPVEVIWGREDRLLSLRRGKKLSAALRAPLVEIPDAGHLPQRENPRQFLAALH